MTLRLRKWLRACGLAALLLLVGAVLSPLRAAAATIPMRILYDDASASARPTATVRIDPEPSLRSERGTAREYVYDEALDGYDDASNQRVAVGAGAAYAYDGWPEHAHRREVRGEGAIYDAPAATAAAEGAGAVISEGKFGYLFGEASGNAHNVARALENASQLSRVGVFNNAEGQALLQAHFDAVVGDSSNIIGSTVNQYGTFVTRQSLFAGPGGFISFQSTWQVLEGGARRFITAIPFGEP